MIVIRRIVAAWLVLGTFSAFAENRDALAASLYVLQSKGLVVNIPAQDAPAVLQHAQTFHSELSARQTACAEQVEKTRFDTKDTLITIILPGGLLYAAGKQQRHAAAKADLHAVSQQMDDLRGDLTRLQQISSRKALALLR